MNRLICPACHVDALMPNSTGDEMLCGNCKKQIGLYDKSQYRMIKSCWLPPTS